MKINKKYFFIIITILMISFFSTNVASFVTDSSPKTLAQMSCDKDALKKDKDDKITTSVLLAISNFQIKTKIHCYIKSNYSYFDNNQLFRPPIYI